jgi:feruloyl esterase
MNHRIERAALVACIGAAGAALQGCGGGSDAPLPPSASFDCAAIASAALGANVKVTQSTRIEADTTRPTSPFTGAPVGEFLPAHCVVQGQIDARTGQAFSVDPATRAVSVVDAPYAIGFELRLPKDWNGRFFFQGGSGLDGVLAPALGVFDPQQGAATNALSRGFAVVSSDGGHRGTSAFDGNFGADQQARLDYAYNALDQVTLTAKDALQKYYGKRPDKSYFVGCSNGGRQAMLASQRFPSYFDGIVAGNPGFNYMNAVSNTLADVRTLAAIVPAGQVTPLGPDLGKAYSPADRALIGPAILAKCDVKGRDNLEDGSVSDPQACDFDPQADIATCTGANDGSCLSVAQKTALAALTAGGKTSSGAALYSDYFYDAGVGSPAWSVWKLDGIPVPLSPTLTLSLGLNQLAGMDGPGKLFSTPANPLFDPFGFDPDADPARFREFGRLADATSVDLSSFKARGGKLMIYNGNSDPLFSSKDIARYYESLAAANGGNAADFARLFLVPGMGHCSGGPATDGFDPLTALQAWVEQGVAPDALVGKAGPATPWPGRTRPLCAFPKVAVYKGSGSIEDAANFSCQ